jgi:hypothetical protein
VLDGWTQRLKLQFPRTACPYRTKVFSASYERGRTNVYAVPSLHEFHAARDRSSYGGMALPDNVTWLGVFCLYQVNRAGSTNVTTRNVLRFNVHGRICASDRARVRDGSSHSYTWYTITNVRPLSTFPWWCRALWRSAFQIV